MSIWKGILGGREKAKTPAEIRTEAVEAAKRRAELRGVEIGREREVLPGMERYVKNINVVNSGQLARTARALDASKGRVIEGKLTLWIPDNRPFDDEMNRI